MLSTVFPAAVRIPPFHQSESMRRSPLNPTTRAHACAAGMQLGPLMWGQRTPQVVICWGRHLGLPCPLHACLLGCIWTTSLQCLLLAPPAACPEHIQVAVGAQQAASLRWACGVGSFTVWASHGFFGCGLHYSQGAQRRVQRAVHSYMCLPAAHPLVCVPEPPSLPPPPAAQFLPHPCRRVPFSGLTLEVP